MATPNTAVSVSSLSRRDTTVSIVIIAGMFFIFGFLSWINAILIPYFKIACELTHFQSYLVAFAFYIAYFVMSVPSSYLLKAVGFKKGMMLGFFALSLGAFIFVPAAMTRTYGVFLLGLFTIGVGLAILQTAANPYITILGPKERAAQRISIMGICNKFAGILAPLLFAAAVLRPTDQALFDSLASMSDSARSAALDELIARVIIPYSIVGAALLLIGIGVRYSPLPEINTEEESAEVSASNLGKTTIFQFPHLILGAVAIFIHVGAQVISIDTIINYAGSMGVSLIEAKVFPSYTLGTAIVGYFLGISVIPRWISQKNMLRLVTLMGAVLSLLIVFARGEVNLFGHQTDISIWFVVLLGIPNSLTWAGIWPLAIDGLGRFTKVGASLLIMGLCGNAILPVVYGYFADSVGLREAYWVLLPCYLYLIYYAMWGHKLRTW
ncbi:glucose/galactose MFS transporter [Parapedobacter pyrenivorans]|uniref:Glucose/galactose MFS transporter n=1 Tax=Parapedobacter pyrenivorans TaxID=1305674 RepID=A0A917I2F8_9SPHI|nr:sugar MFS transporter [Parapedobacter pyrenivorans]GGH03123.1 glucose/galactose MFS transporter [Parapedobacter pyrenivorans]